MFSITLSIALAVNDFNRNTVNHVVPEQTINGAKAILVTCSQGCSDPFQET